MHEYVGNMHLHTTDSDGHGTIQEVSQAAIEAGLDFLIVTDHNTLQSQQQGYYFRGNSRLLRLIGQEVHDVKRRPQKSHLLIYGVERDLSEFASEPQELIGQVGRFDGVSFLAHPLDCAVPDYDQPDLSWDDWNVTDFTGLELWNFMTSFKCLLRSRLHAIYYALFPSRILSGPEPDLMQRWDRMLAEGRQVVVIGNSDAHALPARLGPLRRTIFPYRWLFRAVNTHVLLEERLSGEIEQDRNMIIESLSRGRCYVGYDLPADTRGFMFSGHSEEGKAVMGDRLPFRLGATIQVRCPHPAQIKVIRSGELVREWSASQHGVLTISEPGAYRVEARLPRSSGAIPWIYSNPIYVERA